MSSSTNNDILQNCAYVMACDVWGSLTPRGVTITTDRDAGYPQLMTLRDAAKSGLRMIISNPTDFQFLHHDHCFLPDNHAAEQVVTIIKLNLQNRNNAGFKFFAKTRQWPEHEARTYMTTMLCDMLLGLQQRPYRPGSTINDMGVMIARRADKRVTFQSTRANLDF